MLTGDLIGATDEIVECRRPVCLFSTSNPNKTATIACAEGGIQRPEREGRSDGLWLSLGTSIIAVVALILTVVVMCLSNPARQPHLTTLLASYRLVTPFHQTSALSRSPSSNLDTEEARWENLKGAEHCLRYATRQYTARFVNVPAGIPVLKACRETPVDIHGVTILPHFCENLGIAGGVWAYWTIDFEEPACLTSWGDFVDKGCDDQGNASMTRRFEALLENMQEGDNWQIMCTTTPADLKGFHFPTPTMCERWGQKDTLGVWEVDDLACALPPNQE